MKNVKFLTESARISNAYYKIINEGLESERIENGTASDDIRGIADNIRMQKRPDDDNFISRELDMHDQINRFEDSEYSDPDTVHKMHTDADNGKYGDVVARGYEARYNKNIKPKAGVKWSSVTNSPAAHLPFEKLNRGERPTNREVTRAFDAAANNIDKAKINANTVPNFNEEDHPEGYLDADFVDATDGDATTNESEKVDEAIPLLVPLLKGAAIAGATALATKYGKEAISKMPEGKTKDLANMAVDAAPWFAGSGYGIAGNMIGNAFVNDEVDKNAEQSQNLDGEDDVSDVNNDERATDIDRSGYSYQNGTDDDYEDDDDENENDTTEYPDDYSDIPEEWRLPD